MQFTKQIAGGYFQKADGSWWLLNAQKGWIPVDTNGKAFKYYLQIDTDARATAKFIVIHAQGGYLHRFDMTWFNRFQDDPSCWTDDRLQAHPYTAAQIEKMRPMLETFQGSFTVKEDFK